MALDPIFLTDDGIIIFSKDENLEKAVLSISVIEDGRFISFKDEHK